MNTNVHIVIYKMYFKTIKQELCNVDIVLRFNLSSTASTFTNITHSLGPKRRHVSPFITSLHDEGVVGYFLSHGSKSVASREILIDHGWSIRPSPSAIAIYTTNEPSIGVISRVFSIYECSEEGVFCHVVDFQQRHAFPSTFIVCILPGPHSWVLM